MDCRNFSIGVWYVVSGMFAAGMATAETRAQSNSVPPDECLGNCVMREVGGELVSQPATSQNRNEQEDDIALDLISGQISDDYDPNDILEDDTGGPRFPDWYWDATISSTGENYSHYGDPTQSTNSDLGNHGYSDFDFFSDYRKSAFEHVQLSFSGAYNASAYRHPDFEGLLLERGSFVWEKGDAILPFRFEAGDFFGDYSLRTLQTGLKGVQFEVQPEVIGITNAQSSILFTVGEVLPNYNNVVVGDNLFAGVSALISARDWSASINTVYNVQSGANNTTKGEQSISSIAFDRRFRAGDQRLTFESEAAYFTGGKDLREHQAYGYYLNLAGYSASMPLTYDFTHEAYGKYFKPAGGSVSAERRNYTALASYRHKNNWFSRFRLQRFENAFQSDNPKLTHVAGYSTSGNLAKISDSDTAVFASTDNFINLVRDHDRTVDSVTVSTNERLSWSLDENSDIGLGAGYTRIWDRLKNTTTQNITGNIGYDKYFDIGETAAHMGLGINAGHNESPTSRSDTLGPRLDFDMDYQNHSLSLSYGFNHQWSQTATATTNRNWTHAASLYYAFSKGNHSLGAEVSYDQRDATNKLAAADLRFNLNYTYRFRKASSGNVADRQPDITFDGDGAELTLYDLRPGSSFASIIQLLDDKGISSPSRIQNTSVYEVDWISSLAARQRLAVVNSNGSLERAALLISIPDNNSAAQTERLYRRTLDYFASNYGSPEIFDIGDFTGDVAKDVRTGKLRRIAEWKLPAGILRLGLVTSLNRTLRIEAIYARSHPGVNSNRWGLSQVR